jgi:hypothetical protein
LNFGIAAITHTTCGSNNGSIDVLNTNGGTSPYTYSIDNSAFFSTSAFSNLAAGPHQVVVKDANGCTATNSNMVINGSNPLTLSGTPSNVSCHGGNDGNITLLATGGNGPLTYQVGNQTQSSNIFIGLVANTYLATVVDSMNCSASTSISITEPSAIILPAISGASSPLEQSTESYSISAPGGYSYNWNVTGGGITSGQGSDSISVQWGNAGTGTIQVVVTSPIGCTDTSSTSVVSILSTVGLHQVTSEQVIQVMPNPNNGMFDIRIQNAANEMITLSISDMLGREVYQEQVTGKLITRTIQLSQLSKGIYLVKLNGVQTKLTQKVLIE